MSTKTLPRAVRNANPGNIDANPRNKWVGIMPMAKRNAAQLAEKRFEVFETPVYGFRAMALLLQTYQDKHNLNTIRQLISRWAPGHENNTEAYIAIVARKVGVRADDLIDTHSYEYARPLVEAIAVHETGAGYKWDAKMIDEGLRRAGVTKAASTVAKVPVTKETIGATGSAAVGVGQIADVLPQVSMAMESANHQLSSGSYVQIALGVLAIGIAVFIAYSQVKKHQAGLE